MEAESYLTDGFGIRQSMEAKASGWSYFRELAYASAPPRIKQILVAPGHGVPYLNTSQVFDPKPAPRKWLAMEKTVKAAERFVEQGTILVMASATVGRAIVACKAHENAIVSHHLMRVQPRRKELAGWIYAFLRSPQGQAMMKTTQYASVIRHIEPKHLATLPIPNVSDSIARTFQDRVDEIISCRNDASRLRDAADAALSRAVGPIFESEREYGFSVRVGAVSSGRRRLEAAYHAPHVRAIIDSFPTSQPLHELTNGIWWGNRFKRHYGEGGVPYLSADDLFTMNRYSTGNIIVTSDDGHERLFVRRGWLLMACSGQTYGLNGATTIATEWHENIVFSHDLIRIIPGDGVRAGYLLTALTHPVIGRPLLIREAYGMSIPHLEPSDVARFPVVRLGEQVENEIADLAEGSVREQGRAEMLEQALSEEAGAVISAFLVR